MTRSFKAIFRRIYGRFPFLVRVRQAQIDACQLLRHFRNSILNGSSENLPALRALAARRQQPALRGGAVGVKLIDISIVTYNSERWISGFFESLLAQDYPLSSMHLVFVDNGSQDDTVTALERMREMVGPSFAGFTLIQQENLGFGAGHDRAIQASSADLILVTNIDIEFRRDSLIRVVERASADIAAVASWELRQLPFEHPKHYDPVTLETNWQSHACILFRRSAYEHVGGYEKKIFMYGEDVELSYRFRSYGYVLRYVPSAAVYHHSYPDEAMLLKPLQYSGSTLGNLLVRLRYGSARDRWTGYFLLVGLLFRFHQPFRGARPAIARNLAFVLRNAAHFRRGCGSVPACFPFRAFDFELRRDGAGCKLDVPDDSQRVTIITRTYAAVGRSELLLECGRTVANQTYRNIEWLIVEDGPGVCAGEAIESVRISAPWIIIREIECEKKGRSHAGNVGLEQATGSFCLFLDDDDLLYADHVEVLMAALLKQPDAHAAYSLSFEAFADKPDGTRGEANYQTPEIFRQSWNFQTLLDHNFIPIQALLFNRRLYLERGGFTTDLDQLEDWNLWLRYGHLNRFVYVPKTTSIFHTPSDRDERLRRHESLHVAYMKAKSMAIKTFNKS